MKMQGFASLTAALLLLSQVVSSAHGRLQEDLIKAHDAYTSQCSTEINVVPNDRMPEVAGCYTLQASLTRPIYATHSDNVNNVVYGIFKRNTDEMRLVHVAGEDWLLGYEEGKTRPQSRREWFCFLPAYLGKKLMSMSFFPYTKCLYLSELDLKYGEGDARHNCAEDIDDHNISNWWTGKRLIWEDGKLKSSNPSLVMAHKDLIIENSCPTAVCDGGDSCCTSENPCEEGEGDCDYDSHCVGDLQCGKDNCQGDTFDSTDDCCFAHSGPCDGGDSCCTSAKPCKEGEGDCDYDSHCAGDLKCGNNNCQGDTFDSTDDCCIAGGR